VEVFCCHEKIPEIWSGSMTAKGYDLVDVAYLLVYVEYDYDALHPRFLTPELAETPGIWLKNITHIPLCRLIGKYLHYGFVHNPQ
jgi:hypothetical protein